MEEESLNDNNRLQHVPVIIGNFSPFRLVFRDSDTWSPTYEQINTRNYDYVKLCRLSCHIDVGIAPFSLGISFDGSLILPATPEFRSRESAIAKFNETLGILLLGGIYSDSVQPTDISLGTLFIDGYVKKRNGSSGREATFHSAIQTKHVGNLDVIKLLNPLTISVQEINDAYKKGNNYFIILGNFSPTVLLNGTSNYAKHQWADALIFLWTSIEQVINIIWNKEIIINTSENIDGRSNFLKDFRSWTTANKIELLYQKEFIKKQQYQLLNKARKARNDLVHNGRELKKENAMCALDGLFQIISLVITSYENSGLLNETLETVYKNQKGELYPSKTKFSDEEISCWLDLPPLPGDINWGNKQYERIEDIILKPFVK